MAAVTSKFTGGDILAIVKTLVYLHQILAIAVYSSQLLSIGTKYKTERQVSQHKHMKMMQIFCFGLFLQMKNGTRNI